MEIYIDNEYKCHTTQCAGLRKIETVVFDGCCETYINGFRYVPEGESWTREDGEVFKGKMIAPHTDYTELRHAQAEYEHQLLEQLKAENTDMKTALAKFGVTEDKTDE